MFRKKYIFFLLFYLALILFVATDAWLYQIPVARIQKVRTEESGVKSGARGEKEQYYEQTMEAKLLNGDRKGDKILLKNEYSASQVINQKYHKWDQVLVSLNGEGKTATIKTLKRDVYLAALFGLMVILLLLITKKQGVLTIATLVVNLGIYGAGFTLYLQGKDILKICNLMAILFMVTTLLFLNGFSRKTFAAVLSSFCVLALIMAIFFAVMNRVAEPDYSAMEYLGTIENPEDIFAAEVMLAGLGAIMDVAVTISAALSELLEKKPDLTFRSLFRSGREIGYDIMGTMISVLLFTFGSSLIPSFLIRMNNEVSFLTIVRLHIPLKIVEFLIESIGIVAAIPISILISSCLLRRRGRRSETI